jgi:Xaa-Pro dipeptidase
VKLPFSKAEFSRRLRLVQSEMAARQVDVLLVSDPGNIFWLTGIGDWSFYVPQFAIVEVGAGEPMWIGRAMDVSGARMTTWISPERVHSYPENHIQRPDIHPSDHIGAFVGKLNPKVVGYEGDSYFFSPRSLAALQSSLSACRFLDCELMVSWARAVKSEEELVYLRQAAIIAGKAMATAYDVISPGVRQCDAAAEIIKAQTVGDAGFGGSPVSGPPFILVGERASTAHPIWTDDPFEDEQTIALELGGAAHHYCAGLARTMHLGKAPPARLTDTARAVEEGLEAVLGMFKAGVSGHEVHAAWNAVLARHGLKKESRIGYSIGIGFPPDWGEHTISLRAGEHKPIEANSVVHIILGMWMDGWGMELSETVLVKPDGAECLTQFPRRLFRKDG